VSEKKKKKKKGQAHAVIPYTLPREKREGETPGKAALLAKRKKKEKNN